MTFCSSAALLRTTSRRPRATRRIARRSPHAFITRAEARAYGLRERRVDIGDGSLTVLEGGPADAPVVVLLHGYTADRVVWVRFARHLLRDHRVVIPKSRRPRRDRLHVRHRLLGAGAGRRVATLLDRLGVERADVAGNSMGGFVAATLAIARPDLVRSLILSDAVGVHSPEPSDAEHAFREGRNPFLLDDVALFPEFYAMTMAKAPFVPAFVRPPRRRLRRAPRRARGDLRGLLRHATPRRPAP